MVRNILSLKSLAGLHSTTSKLAVIPGSTVMRIISRITASCTHIYSKELQRGAYIDCIHRLSWNSLRAIHGRVYA